MKQFLTILAAVILLWVVVCPITPTPVAVLSGNAPAVHAPVLLLAIAAVAPLPRAEIITGAHRPRGEAVAMSGSVVDLTCARLC